MKKVLCLLLSVALALTLLPLSSFAIEPEEGLNDQVQPSGIDGYVQWQISGSQLIISGNGPMNDYDKGTAPWTDWLANGTVNSVIIENGITKVGNYAFFAAVDTKNAVSSVSIPSSVLTIGQNAFTRCSLTALTLPEGVTSLGSAAFSYNNISGVTMPSTMRTIEKNCFGGNTTLANVTLNNGLESIGQSAFQNGVITKIDIPATVSSVGENISPANCKLFFAGDMPAVMGIQTYNTVYYLETYPAWINYEGSKVLRYADGSLAKGTAGSVNYVVSGDGNIEISGSGDLPGYPAEGQQPWYSTMMDQQGKTLTIGAEVSSIGSLAFAGCNGIDAIVFQGCPVNIAEDAFRDVTAEVFYTCYKKGTESGWRTWVNSNFGGTLTWTAIHVPAEISKVEPTCEESGLTVGKMCSRCESILQEQEIIPALGHTEEIAVPGYAQTCSEPGMTDATRCSVCLKPLAEQKEIPPHFPVIDEYVEPTATKPGLTEGSHCKECNLILQAQEEIPANGYPICIGTEVAGEDLYVGGRYYHADENGTICIADSDQKMAILYSWNGSATDPHTCYPNSMKLYRLTWDGEKYSAEHLAGLDNLLTYCGNSIRLTGTRGIRMITGIPTGMKNQLKGSGVDGYTLKETGTVVAFAEQLGAEQLTLQSSCARSAAAFIAGSADPVFGTTSSLTQFTNVLVGFSAEQCAQELVLRPYAILKDADGNLVTVYGGAVQRSIGYVAWQNRNVYKPGTAEYKFVWNLIHSAFGSEFDSEYKG